MFHLVQMIGDEINFPFQSFQTNKQNVLENDDLHYEHKISVRPSKPASSGGPSPHSDMFQLALFYFEAQTQPTLCKNCINFSKL